MKTSIITNPSSTPDSSCGCGISFYASFNRFPTSTACCCFSLGLMPAPELLSLDAHGSLLGLIHGTATLEQWAAEEKCAFYFIPI